MKNKKIYESIDSLYKVTVSGQEHIQTIEPRIYISNQVSIIDFRIILNQLPENTYIIASQNLIDLYPTLTEFQVNMIIIEMGSTRSLKKIFQLLKEGNNVLIYPEGELSKMGTVMKLQDGAPFFARKSRVALQPIVIEGTEQSPFSTYGTTGYTKTKHFPKVQVKIGKPFYLPENLALSKAELREVDKELLTRQLNETLLALDVREKRNLWNDLLNAKDRYGSKKKIIKMMEANLTYEDLLEEIGYQVSAFREKLISKEVGVLLPNSIFQMATVFALFKLRKTPYLYPFDQAESINAYYQLSPVKTLVTSRLFIQQLGLEDWVSELEEQLDILYIEDIQRTKRKFHFLTFKRHRMTEEEGELEVVFFRENKMGIKEGVVFTHSQLAYGSKQAALVVQRQIGDILYSLLPYSSTLGFSFGMLFPLLNGLPFISKSFPKNTNFGEMVYFLSPTILVSPKKPLEIILEKGDAKDLNFTDRIYTTEDCNQEFEDQFLKRFGKLLHVGHYTGEYSGFLSLRHPTLSINSSEENWMPGVKPHGIDGFETQSRCQGYIKVRKEKPLQDFKSFY